METSTPPEEILVRGDSVELPALRATPAHPRPGTVLLIHENRGLVGPMVDLVRDLTARGHTVVAPDLLGRIGGTPAFAADPSSVSTRDIADEIHDADLVAIHDALEPPVSVVGLCWGAEMGWRLLATRSPDRAALLYGICPEPDSVLPTDTSVLAIYAEDDPRVNDTLESLCDTVRSTDADVRLVSFPDTKHAFLDHSRPERYHPQAARVAWDLVAEFLDGSR